jgi:hypothetical protein
MPQEIALTLIKKHPHLALNTLQIKHLKHLGSKVNQNDVIIDMCFGNNEHGFDNIIQKYSNECLPKISANIISFETIDHEPSVHSKKK